MIISVAAGSLRGRLSDYIARTSVAMDAMPILITLAIRLLRYSPSGRVAQRSGKLQPGLFKQTPEADEFSVMHPRG